MGGNNASTTFSGSLSGSGGLTKLGTGMLTLSRSNAYTGLTSINAGTLSLAHSAALAANGNITFGGGTLQFTASNALDYANRIINSGSPIQLDTNGQNVTFASGLISSNSAGLTKLGSGKLTLSASDGYRGLTSINAGTLSLAHSAALAGNGNITFGGGTLQFTASNTLDYANRIINSSGPIQLDSNGQNVTFSGGLTNSNTAGLTKLGAGMLSLAGANACTGLTSINGGTLSLGHPAALAANGNITFGGGTLQFTASNALDYASGIVNSSSPIQLDTNAQNVLFSGGLTSSNTAGLTKFGAGMLTLAGANGYTGLTAINAGTLSLAHSAALAGNGNITFGGGTLQFTASNVLDYANRIVNSSGPIQLDTNGQSVTFAGSLSSSNLAGLTKAGPGSLTLSASNGYKGATLVSSGTLQVGNGGSGASIGSTSNVFDNASLVFNHADTVTFDPVISGNGSLTKLGSGTLVLTGSNAYTGATLVSGGTLLLANTGAALRQHLRQQRQRVAQFRHIDRRDLRRFAGNGQPDTQ